MNYFQAVALGLVQGLTEFLPVSSSAHLVFFQNIFGLEEPMLFFDVMLHLGTLASILVFFRKDIMRIIQALLGRLPEDGPKSWIGGRSEGWRYVIWIVIATIPAGLAGVLFDDAVSSAFNSMRTAAIFLLVTGGILFVTGRIKTTTAGVEAQKLSPLRVLAIGLAQAVALFPGISRSGSTICASLFAGMNRDAAARFSFLLAIPAILGAFVLEFSKAIGTQIFWGPTIIGTVVAFVSGIAALAIVIGALRKGRLAYFSIYCWAAGLFFIVLSFFR